MPPRHDRPVALITGASRRVGAVTARTLHAAGYDLALHYRCSGDDARALADELERRRGGSTLLLQAELADLPALPALLEQLLARYGRLDALVNNASAFFPTPLGTATPAQWNTLFASNAQAPFFLSQAAIPALREARGGIVNLVDIYAERPLAQHTVYCMAKAALAAMTRSLALELAPHIRVNGVAPGAVLWPSDGKPYADQQAMLARTPLQRAGTPEDVAGAVLWLLRDAPYVTGQVIRVDGGRTLSV
ncbi:MULTISPECIES: pteridine reductase [Rhodanobacter]|uniref:pteridine reductase n=1 Tax=Rhodanobacter TaxID=75309 RepID=UPI00040B596E|nr:MULTISPECIES: pteridine reductase [Rhodanobacter]KZC18774.1 pteridine reductase [Rhodanobacter denitrificans]UJJ51334.1 pteridine reductase [Rhodanobacter denitrificans]UJM94081.1 pteridine reductase [Rhodanobacter denitrificans]UJM97610.1 pteridine reductase [Rhodanobacter denitrificans]UJN22975.1 pteridine reductase [Rhodanobacter denitrificans]